VKIDEGTLLRVAELARLELSSAEKEEFAAQLSDIISYVEKINELDTSGVSPTDHIVELQNVFRDDTVKDSIPVEEIVKIAPQFENGHIIVPIILEEKE
jgi:aspartyl-tRNA(Asn)/glutamyl-tRNA(Gln) amidotransferase subunit C